VQARPLSFPSGGSAEGSPTKGCGGNRYGVEEEVAWAREAATVVESRLDKVVAAHRLALRREEGYFEAG